MRYFQKANRIALIVAFATIAATGAANARVTMDAHTEYVKDASIMGQANSRDKYSVLENIYNLCDASDKQWDELEESFKTGLKHVDLLSKEVSNTLLSVVSTKLYLRIGLEEPLC